MMAQINRRDFLKTSSLAAVGAAVAPALGQAQEPKTQGAAMDKKIRIGIVGGGFGASFFWHEHPNCTVQAVSDLRPERRELLMKTYGCAKSYESLEKLILDKEIDAVGVFTGAPDHARHVTACLKAGKHVISAVPCAMTLEECQQILDTVKHTGLTYMMAETSWWHQSVITARKWFQEGKFGRIYSTEAEYHHPGLEELYMENGQKTWRYGLPPMHYPTHCTGYLVGVTGERMTQVSCMGWGDDSPFLKDNVYKNPFWNETAFFTTNQGNSFRVSVCWKGAMGGCERGQWYGEKMSFFDPSENGLGPIVRRLDSGKETDDGGFVRQVSKFEKHDQKQWWQTEMLPEPLRHTSGHGCSHTFITHEFIDALVHGRKPEVDIYKALALTVPGIVAHQSALQGGKQLVIPDFS